MSDISKMTVAGSILKQKVSSEIARQLSADPGSWSLKETNEGYLAHGAQCYAAIEDGQVAKMGIKGIPIVGR